MKKIVLVALLWISYQNLNAEARLPELTPNIIINKIPYYPQFYFYALFAKGVPNPLNNTDVHLLKIKEWSQVQLNQCDHQRKLCSAQFDPKFVPAENGPQTSYDFLVLVVSSTPDFMWTNSDGTPALYPLDKMPSGTNQDRFAVRIITRSKILKQSSAQEFNFNFTSGQ